MDTAHWPQEIVVKPMEEIVVSKPSSSSSLERKVRPQKEQALNCPRCNSTNTKFCYYNNYSLTQPRYFCKGCRRYWTEGGSLRNIPFGGGSRKNKRSNNSSANSSRKLPNLAPPQPISASHESTNSQNPKIIHEGGQDLNLAYPSHHHDFKTISELIQVPNFDSKNNMHEPSSALELLTGISSTNSRGLMSSFMPMPMTISDPNTIYSSGFSLQDQFKPTLNFSLDGLGINNGGYGSGGRLLFPFEDIKQVPSNTSDHIEQQNRDHQGDSTGYWNGVLGGGGGSW